MTKDKKCKCLDLPMGEITYRQSIEAARRHDNCPIHVPQQAKQQSKIESKLGVQDKQHRQDTGKTSASCLHAKDKVEDKQEESPYASGSPRIGTTLKEELQELKNSSQDKQEWEEEFDNRWWPQVDETFGLQLKEWIQSLLSQERERLIKMVELPEGCVEHHERAELRAELLSKLKGTP
jgi:hypothetical protein